MPSVMITGASRGIGLELARQYAADGWRVHACCRTPAKAAALQALPKQRTDGAVTVHALDVDDGASVEAAARELSDARLDVLINNAGINPHRDTGLGSIDYAAWERCLRTNVLGPVRVTEAFADRLAGEKKLVTVSSRMGSIGENAATNAIIYRSSKAAVNMAMKAIANGLAGRGVIAVSVHPGWVKTDMGGAAAALETSDSARRLRQVIAGLGKADNGSFLNYDGTPIPW